MKTKKPKEVAWLPDVESHDYPAAEAYLSLLLPANQARSLVRKLRVAPTTFFKAKDIFRASQLSLLGVSNSHVEKDRLKMLAGQALSPILLVRDPANGRVVIADGYHRLCALYGFDEDARIHCKIV